MGCAACGQKRIGFSERTAFVLGSDAPGSSKYVQIRNENIIKNVRVGEYRWVTGSGVEQAIEEGLILESGSRPKAASHLRPREVWCVNISDNEKCFRTRDQASRYSKMYNAPIEHKEL